MDDSFVLGEDKSWQAQMVKFVVNYLRNVKAPAIYSGNRHLEISPSYAINHGYKVSLKEGYNNSYFHFYIYKTSKFFGYAVASEGFLGDTKFKPFPIYNFVGDEGQTDITEEDRQLAIKFVDRIMNIVDGMNAALKKDVEVLEEKFLIDKECENINAD